MEYVQQQHKPSRDNLYHLYSRVGASRTAPASPLPSRHYGNSYSLSDPASAYNSPERLSAAVMNAATSSFYPSSLKSDAFVSDASTSLPSSFLALNSGGADVIPPSYSGAYYAPPAPQTRFDSIAVAAARRGGLQRLRHHSSFDSSYMPMVGAETYGQNDPLPPADPQILMPVLYGSPGAMRRPFPSGRPLNANLASAASNYAQTYTNPLMDAGDKMDRFGAPGVGQRDPYGAIGAFPTATDPSNVGGFNGGSGGVGGGASGASFPDRDVNPSSLYRGGGAVASSSMDREALRRELENSSQKLNAMMNSIRTFWSPELKKERALRKEEASKLMVAQEQLKMAAQDSQRQAVVIRQLQSELQCQTEQCQSMRQGEFPGGVSREEYDAVLMERDMYYRDLAYSRDAIQELENQFEIQRQTLLSREESVKKLLDALHGKGLVSYSTMQDRLELEQCRAKIIELENKCIQLEAALQKTDRYGCSAEESTVIEQLEKEVDDYRRRLEELKEAKAVESAEAAKTQAADRNLEELKAKNEKLDMELSQKALEIQTLHTRLSTAEETASELKKHVEVVKESNSSKDQQIELLQNDIDTLRKKLESRNELLDQKNAQINDLQVEKNRTQSELTIMNEQMKIYESKLTSADEQVKSLETVAKDRDRQLIMMRQRLDASPSMVQQKQIQGEIDSIVRERDQLMQDLKDLRSRTESKRLEEVEAHRKEVRDLRLAIETLQSEISDRQMLIESQNEKISDLNRELTQLQSETRVQRRATPRGSLTSCDDVQVLSDELTNARAEIERLSTLISKMDDDGKTDKSSASGFGFHLDKSVGDGCQQCLHFVHEAATSDLKKKDQRIEELEEALKESVSITAERELAIAHQKQLSQRLEQKINVYQEQVKKLQQQIDEMNERMNTLKHEKQEKDHVIRSLKHDRRRHMEEVMQLKEESLLAAISEKDAHIALLESTQNVNPGEVETVRQHKEKLLQKLKEENAQRVKFINEQKDEDVNAAADQDDDAEGIWA